MGLLVSNVIGISYINLFIKYLVYTNYRISNMFGVRPLVLELEQIFLVVYHK